MMTREEYKQLQLLNQKRKELGIRHIDLALRTGISVGTIGNRLNGYCPMDNRTLRAIEELIKEKEAELANNGFQSRVVRPIG
jgi:hypothetical protein